MEPAHKLFLLVPVLNEAKELPSQLHSLGRLAQPNIEFIFADGGSTDESLCLLEAFLRKNPQSRLFSDTLPSPSIARTLELAFPYLRQHASDEDLILFLPADCRLKKAAIAELFDLPPGPLWGGFPKRYFPSNLTLALYAFLQNRILSRWKHQLVWTNGIFLRASIFRSIRIPTPGFLEDVLLSDLLGKIPAPFRLLRNSIDVNARRYQVDGCWKRIGINGSIVLRFRLGEDIASLRKCYLRFRNQKA